MNEKRRQDAGATDSRVRLRERVETRRSGRAEHAPSPQIRSEEGLAFGGAAGAGLFGAVAHFFAVALEFAEGVDGLVLGFVVGTSDDLTQEAHGDKLDAADDQGDAGDHQGAVLAHDGDAVSEFFENEVSGVEQAE